MPSKIDSGLNMPEETIADHLASAWNVFVLLNPERDDLDDFRRAIHEAQRILQSRALARVFPDFWRSNGG
jgi:hypothetical protein